MQYPAIITVGPAEGPGSWTVAAVPASGPPASLVVGGQSRRGGAGEEGRCFCGGLRGQVGGASGLARRGFGRAMLSRGYSRRVRPWGGRVRGHYAAALLPVGSPFAAGAGVPLGSIPSYLAISATANQAHTLRLPRPRTGWQCVTSTEDATYRLGERFALRVVGYLHDRSGAPGVGAPFRRGGSLRHASLQAVTRARRQPACAESIFTSSGYGSRLAPLSRPGRNEPGYIHGGPSRRQPGDFAIRLLRGHNSHFGAAW